MDPYTRFVGWGCHVPVDPYGSFSFWGNFHKILHKYVGQ